MNDPMTATPLGFTQKFANSSLDHVNRPTWVPVPLAVSLFWKTQGSDVGDRVALPASEAENGRSFAEAAPVPSTSAAATVVMTTATRRVMRGLSADLVAGCCLRRQDVAGSRLLDQPVGVRLQEEAFRHRPGRRRLHGLDVAGVIAVALLERQARIVVRHPLRPRPRERHHPRSVVTDLSLVEPAGDDVPSEIRAEWRVTQDDRDAAKLVAVRVGAWHLRLEHVLDGRRDLRAHA